MLLRETCEPLVGPQTQVIEAEQFYTCPGLIDGHIDFESTMLEPSEFVRVVLPKGTTSVMIDPHEITNVLGVEGVRLMFERTENIPLIVYVQAPSCVPSTTNLETHGARLGSREIEIMPK